MGASIEVSFNTTAMRNFIRIFLFLQFVNLHSAIAQEGAVARFPQSIPSLEFVSGNVDSVDSDIVVPGYKMADSLNFRWQSVDSIKAEFYNGADSLTYKYQTSVGRIDQSLKMLKGEIDSLSSLGLSTDRLTRSFDSLASRKAIIDNDFSAKCDSLKTATLSKLDSIQISPEMKAELAPLSQQVKGFNLHSKGLEQIPDFSARNVDIINNGSIDISGLPFSNAPAVDTQFKDVFKLTHDIEGLNKDLVNVSQTEIPSAEQLPEAVSDHVTNVEGIDELKKQAGILKDFENQVSDLKTSDMVKRKAAEVVKTEAINHFAGKEEQLKAALNKASGLKQKYSSVKNLKELSKCPRNSMKEKPFVERIIPGLFIQFQKRHFWLVDFNPYLGFRLSGRLVTGIGWNQRIAYTERFTAYVSAERIYGPRAFGDFKVGRGYSLHLEQELMNTFVPSYFLRGGDIGDREWVWSTMVGIKKHYRIYKNLRGTALLQYNVFDAYYKSPYLDRLNSRIGLEYTLKKKKKLEQNKG